METIVGTRHPAPIDLPAEREMLDGSERIRRRAMTGVDALTGRRIDGVEHLRQSVRDILTTPLGSRVMRAAYGSRLHELLDAPLNAGAAADIYAAAAEALAEWEPRLTVRRIRTAAAAAGGVTIDIEGEYNGRAIEVVGVAV